jgi:DNA modification methylase
VDRRTRTGHETAEEFAGSGSGTVIIACQNEGRIGLGIEILPKYGAVILERYKSLTGVTPRLVGG